MSHGTSLAYTTDALLRVAALLERPLPDGLVYDPGHWYTKTERGILVGAAGLAGLQPWFRRRHFRTIDGTVRYVDKHPCITRPHIWITQVYDGMRAIEEFFALSQWGAEWLFTDQIPPAALAARIRRYVAERWR